MVSAFINAYLISEISSEGLEIEETVEPRLTFDIAADTYLRNSFCAGLLGCEYVSNGINECDENCCTLLEAFC